MSVYKRTKFQVSRIILTSFRQRVILPLPPPQNELLKSPPLLGLRNLKNQNFILTKKHIKKALRSAKLKLR